MVKRVAGCVIFRRFCDQIEYLLIRAAYGEFHWSVPKGHVARGEDEFTAALRETKEETGYDEADLKVYKDKSLELKYESKNKQKTAIYWLAELRDSNKPVVLSPEHTEMKWLTKEEANEIAEYSRSQDIFDKFHCMILEIKHQQNNEE